jgi:hypothetical protein
MATPYNKVAEQLSHLMFLGTEFAIESHAGAGIPKMTDGLVKRMVPRTWPDVTEEQLHEIAIRIPIINYVRSDKKIIAQRIADLLREVIPEKKRNRAGKRPARR